MNIIFAIVVSYILVELCVYATSYALNRRMGRIMVFYKAAKYDAFAMLIFIPAAILTLIHYT